VVAPTCRLVAVIALAASSVPAWADSARSEQLGREAEALASSGDYPGAAARYRDAYREFPRPDLMCNVGVAYYKAKDLPRAHRYLDQCVTSRGSLDKDFIANVRMVLTAVEQKLSTGDYKPLNFIIQPQSATTTFASGDHDEPLVGSRQVWVPFGSYRVTIHAEGYVDRVLEITATNRDRDEHSVKLEPITAAKPTPDPDRPRPVPDMPPPPPARERSLVAPIIASAATGVLGGIAVGFYFAARSSAADANDEQVARADYAVHADDARSRQRISWGFGAVAGAAAITATILWVRAMRKPAPVEVSATRTSAGILLIGRW